MTIGTGNVNICLTKNFTLVIIVLALGITSIQCNRSCASCRKSLAHCNQATGICNSNCRRTKLCKRQDDLCLATWRWRDNKLVMFTSCFRLPPFSNSSQFNAKCEAEILNGTRTCLCQGSDCNINPTEPVTPENKKQALGIESSEPKRLQQKRNLTEDFSKSIGTKPEKLMANNASKNTSAIVWISLAAVLLPLLIAGLISRLRRCSGHLETKLLQVVEDSPPIGESDCERISQDSKPNKSVTLETVLSQGRYASVWKGHVMAQNVAVKIFPVTSTSSWQKERDIYDLLSEEHSNITKIIALKDTQEKIDEPLWLIMDYCENGSLRDYLAKKVLSWSEAVVLASGITSGVAFLHSECIRAGSVKVAVAHRDLKSTNVLVKKDGTSVISDFGLAVSLNYIHDESKNIQVGTYRYMSPEELLTTVALDSTETFKQMDIYSMALVLWEIISRCEVADFHPEEYQLPFAEMVGADAATLNNMVEVVALKLCRPYLPSTDHEGLKLFCETVQECWDPDPEARLTADGTEMRLKELLLMT